MVQILFGENSIGKDVSGLHLIFRDAARCEGHNRGIIKIAHQLGGSFFCIGNRIDFCIVAGLFVDYKMPVIIGSDTQNPMFSEAAAIFEFGGGYKFCFGLILVHCHAIDSYRGIDIVPYSFGQIIIEHLPFFLSKGLY